MTYPLPTRTQTLTKTLRTWASVPKASLLFASAIVFVTAYAGIEFTRVSGQVAVIWPADAFMLAILLRSPRHSWGPFLIAGFIGNSLADWLGADPLNVALMLAACNTLNIAVSITLFSRFVEMPADLTRAPTFARFLLICGGIAPAVSAAAGAFVLHVMSGLDPLPVFQTWFASCALGILTIVPLLLMLRTDEWRQIVSKSNRTQTIGILFLVAAASLAIFLQDNSPLLFMIFPFLILAAFRLRFVGAALAMGILAVISIPLTIAGQGPFALMPTATMPEKVVLLQVFLVTVVFTVLPIAAVLNGRRRLERETLAARRAAERANAAKSAFLTNMSHELRTPMTGIIGMCDLLLAGNQSPEQKGLTETLERSARSFLELLNDLLDLAKIEAGRMDLETTDFRLSQVMKDVQEFFAPAMSQKGLAFTIECEPTDHDVLSGDPKRLRQIFFNLVGNALKFTDKGSVVVRRRQRLSSDGTVMSEFEVEDTGIGMSLEAQRRLFRPFEQEDSSTSRRFGGTGLGLNISKQIVEAMGGEITVQSVQGVGSTFAFNVQLLPGLAEKIEPRFAITPARIGDVLKDLKLKILFAEDNATTQFLVRQVMEMWGHAITVVENGRQAIDRAQAETFDVILMDMQMPVMDGSEAVRILRRSGAPNNAVPIIALTADAILENRARYLEAGCDVVVTKPIEWQVLAREIKTLIDRKAPGYVAETALSRADNKESPVEVSLPIFDRQRIDGLSEGLGAALMVNLLTRCLASMNQYMEAMRIAADEGDFAKLRRHAHDLKSVCAQFGAIRASEIARAIEVDMPDLEAAKSILDELRDCVARAMADIEEIRSQMATGGPRPGKSAA